VKIRGTGKNRLLPVLEATTAVVDAMAVVLAEDVLRLQAAAPRLAESGFAIRFSALLSTRLTNRSNLRKRTRTT